MDTAPLVEIRVRQRFSAPAERVLSAWIDPATAGKWLFATATRPAASVGIDARVGGAFCFVERRGGTDIAHAGEYVEIARPRRLVFTLSEQGRSRGPSRVVVEIVPVATGCELTLVHESVPPDQARRIEGRWAGMLYGLGTILAR
jgi:uncharacterized protein YndB with AHSA1/START domain